MVIKEITINLAAKPRHPYMELTFISGDKMQFPLTKELAGRLQTDIDLRPWSSIETKPRKEAR